MVESRGEKESDYTLDTLKKLFSYDSLTREFISTNPRDKRNFGKVAGTTMKKGYVRIGARVAGKLRFYLAHRLAWAFHYGKWPGNFIDHKDRVKSNNCISNLRDVTRSINAYNYSREGKNSTGYRGVSVDLRKGLSRYRAYYGKKYLGSFDTPEEAAEAYNSFVGEIHNIIVED